MRFNLSVVVYLTSLLLLSACQTIPQKNGGLSATSDLGSLPSATPIQISYKDEVNLLRLNQILTEQKDLKISERARLFYERGLIYDRMGLTAHSRYDLNMAINTDPTFAPAYNILGLYLLISGDYDEAFEAFDSALELADNMEYSYLHRAIGLYQVERYRLASDDIETFYQLDNHDPYRILWRYIINSKLAPTKALLDLKAAEHLINDKRFAWSIIDVVAQRVSEKQFFKSLEHGLYSNQGLAQRLCEAYFYLGYWHKMAGDSDKGSYYFKLAMASNIHDFIEYKYALIELNALEAKRNTNED